MLRFIDKNSEGKQFFSKADLSAAFWSQNPAVWHKKTGPGKNREVTIEKYELLGFTTHHIVALENLKKVLISSYMRSINNFFSAATYPACSE